jgi:hypothetical protein
MVTGRCYCGRTRLKAARWPDIVAYCHCADCRRFTGAPVAAMAGFADEIVVFEPDEGQTASVAPGVTRSFCGSCGSPLTSRFDYLPGQVYIPVGILDQADDLPPRVHAHDSERLRWLHIDDDIERFDHSSRERLLEAESKNEEVT